MSIAGKYRLGLSLAALLALVSSLPVAAQPPPDIKMGDIAGTGIARDEFRARAEAQLVAIALNACTYYVAKGEMPASYAALRGSEAWNLQLENMFTGRRMQDIYFEPQPEDMTAATSIGPGMLAPDVPPAMPSAAPPAGEADADGFEPEEPQVIGVVGGGTWRIDPRRVRDFVAGDVLYFASDELLQLVIFAPDGSFVERVDPTPYPNWRENLTLAGEGVVLPRDIYAAEVLYYAERLLPEYYALVQFMGGLPGATEKQIQNSDAAARLSMASELGITIMNPYGSQPATAAPDASPGNFLLTNNSLPLLLVLPEGHAASLDQLQGAGLPGPANPQSKPPAKPKPPKPGGGAPPGGGHSTR